jgi:hypothetical protein
VLAPRVFSCCPLNAMETVSERVNAWSGLAWAAKITLLLASSKASALPVNRTAATLHVWTSISTVA